MRRKNWISPGFLVLVSLLLFSFPGLASAADNSAKPVTSGQEIISAVPPGPDGGEAVGGNTVAKQDVVIQPVHGDVLTKPASVNSDPASASNDTGALSKDQSSSMPPSAVKTPDDTKTDGGLNVEQPPPVPTPTPTPAP
ncbi:MAG: hypothetical protein ACYC21_14480, partial [Eubacteriales bacterium]